MKTAKCPKCKSRDLFLNEQWRGHNIQFEQLDGVIDRAGNLAEGNPYAVYGDCHKCGYAWKLKGVTQIADLTDV